MSILIKGMEMPPNCRQCSLYLQSMDSERNVYENCAITAKSYNWGLTTRPSDCPLAPVPPHGRLIDADAEETIVHCNNEENAKIIATILNMDADGHYLLYSSIFGEEEETAPPKEEK